MDKTQQTIRFGMHRGKRYVDLPINYLLWLIANARDNSTIDAAEQALSDKGLAQAKARRHRSSKR